MSERLQLVTFRLGDDLFAADVFAVERVLRKQQPRPVPDMPDWLLGVIAHQGRTVPVLDLRRRFGLPPVTDPSLVRVLIIDIGEGCVGATVDEVLEVATVDPATVDPPPALFKGLAKDYLRGLVRRGEAVVVWLDTTRLLTATERLTLEQASTHEVPA